MVRFKPLVSLMSTSLFPFGGHSMLSALMRQQIRFLGEDNPCTLIAHMLNGGLKMYHIMTIEVKFCHKRFSANLTSKWLFARMCLLVPIQTTLLGESFSTSGTNLIIKMGTFSLLISFDVCVYPYNPLTHIKQCIHLKFFRKTR